MSLRARLMIVTVSLVAAGLLVADVLTYRALAASLYKRVDEQLVQAERPAADALGRSVSGDPSMPPGGPMPDLGPPAGTYAALLDPNGTVLHETTINYGDAATSARPILRGGLPGSTVNATGSVVFTSEATDGSGRFRVQAISLLQPATGTFVVAIPLTEVGATLGRLLAIEALVTLAVAALAGALALWLVRVGLRPLETIGETAGAIAAGDLSRRVEPTDDRTEIGKLGSSLNAMLSQIEAAFEERRASEARLRRFVADASHELRTPLTSIRGYAELFRRGADERPADLATSMARIEAEAERMGVLVDDLLLLARLDQGRQLEREAVDLSEVVADAIESAHAIEPARVIELSTSSPALVEGDPGRLRQVVDNLLENARVHTPAGTPTRVSVETQDGSVVLTIADEGPGMDPDVAARAFERFYRGDPARARTTGGVGLGLSIVAAIVQAHGGAVHVVDGAPGTTIEVRLPVTRVVPAAT
jgi:two-component system OmpR family sensor kinase